MMEKIASLKDDIKQVREWADAIDEEGLDREQLHVALHNVCDAAEKVAEEEAGEEPYITVKCEKDPFPHLHVDLSKRKKFDGWSTHKFLQWVIDELEAITRMLRAELEVWDFDVPELDEEE